MGIGERVDKGAGREAGHMTGSPTYLPPTRSMVPRVDVDGL